MRREFERTNSMTNNPNESPTISNQVTEKLTNATERNKRLSELSHDFRNFLNDLNLFLKRGEAPTPSIEINIDAADELYEQAMNLGKFARNVIQTVHSLPENLRSAFTKRQKLSLEHGTVVSEALSNIALIQANITSVENIIRQASDTNQNPEITNNKPNIFNNIKKIMKGLSDAAVVPIAAMGLVVPNFDIDTDQDTTPLTDRTLVWDIDQSNQDNKTQNNVDAICEQLELLMSKIPDLNHTFINDDNVEQIIGAKYLPTFYQLRDQKYQELCASYGIDPEPISNSTEFDAPINKTVENKNVSPEYPEDGGESIVTPEKPDVILSPTRTEQNVTRFPAKINADDGLSFRVDPNSDAYRESTLANGANIDVIGKNGEWLLIVFNNEDLKGIVPPGLGDQVGWVFGEYVVLENNSLDEIPQATIEGEIGIAHSETELDDNPENGTEANLRMSPDFNSESVALIPNGAIIEVTASVEVNGNIWYLVTMNSLTENNKETGVTGWMAAHDGVQTLVYNGMVHEFDPNSVPNMTLEEALAVAISPTASEEDKKPEEREEEGELTTYDLAVAAFKENPNSTLNISWTELALTNPEAMSNLPLSPFIERMIEESGGMRIGNLPSAFGIAPEGEGEYTKQSLLKLNINQFFVLGGSRVENFLNVDIPKYVNFLEEISRNNNERIIVVLPDGTTTSFNPSTKYEGKPPQVAYQIKDLNDISGVPANAIVGDKNFGIVAIRYYDPDTNSMIIVFTNTEKETRDMSGTGVTNLYIGSLALAYGNNTSIVSDFTETNLRAITLPTEQNSNIGLSAIVSSADLQAVKDYPQYTFPEEIFTISSTKLLS